MLANTGLFHSNGKVFSIRFASEQDVPAVRELVNVAYRELADSGLNCTCSYQDDEMTRERMAKGQTILMFDGSVLVGTIHLRQEVTESGESMAYICQFGIHPDYRHQRLGSALMEMAERVAKWQGHKKVRLDTPRPARHLVEFYLRRCYLIVDEIQLDGKTYNSCLFEKPLV